MGVGEGDPRGEKDARTVARSRPAGCLPLLLVLAALPTLGVGFLIYTSSRTSASATSGIAGGLAGLGEVVGLGAMVFAAILFLGGAIGFVRAAKR